jgi:hypothetical protein
VSGGRPALRSGVFLANLRASPRCLLADGRGCYSLRQVWGVLPKFANRFTRDYSSRRLTLPGIERAGLGVLPG